MRTIREERGQAAAELTALLPLILFSALALAQLALVGYALWCAGDAARAGARAAHVGSSARLAALRAAPEKLGPEVRVRTDVVRVELRAPTLVPGLPAIPVSAASNLDPAPGGPASVN